MKQFKKALTVSDGTYPGKLRRTQFVIINKWCRLEYFKNGISQIALTGPAGSIIRIRYGWRWFSLFSPIQELDGIHCKKLIVIRSLHFFASAEIFASRECFVSFTMI